MAVPNPQSAAAMQEITRDAGTLAARPGCPPAAQENVLHSLLAISAQTGCGRKRGAEQIGSIDDFRAYFPIATSEDYQPLIHRMMADAGDDIGEHT